MQLQVDKAQRFAKMRAHTATHLLHAEIAKLIPNTQQVGSHVDEDYLRFDFQTERLLTNSELTKIEKTINQYIYEAQEVTTEESNMVEAQKRGAKAFFEDKYGDTVRVVSIYKEGEEKGHSVELCGGTHIDNTSKIGAFAIVGQEAVASGIKRIIAVTGPKVFDELENIKTDYETQASKLGVTRKQFPEKIDKNLKYFEDLQEKYESLIEKYNQRIAEKIDKDSSIKELEGIQFKHFELGEAKDSVDFRVIVNKFKELYLEKYGNLLISNSEGQFAIISSEEYKKAKYFKKYLGLKGGGNDNIVQGKDPEIIKIKNDPNIADLIEGYSREDTKVEVSISAASDYTKG